MENTIQIELLALVEACAKFRKDYLPENCSFDVSMANCGSPTVSFHSLGQHDEGLAIKRTIGMEDAEKAVFDPQKPWHILRGKLTPDVTAIIYCKGLPPSCRIETYEEEIPKTQLVDLPETVKVKRTRICCGEGK